ALFLAPAKFLAPGRRLTCPIWDTCLQVLHLQQVPAAVSFDTPAPSSWCLEGPSTPGPRLIRGGVQGRECSPDLYCQCTAYRMENDAYSWTLAETTKSLKHR